jgi:hypothetical protein
MNRNIVSPADVANIRAGRVPEGGHPHQSVAPMSWAGGFDVGSTYSFSGREFRTASRER